MKQNVNENETVNENWIITAKVKIKLPTSISSIKRQTTIFKMDYFSINNSKAKRVM